MERAGGRGHSAEVPPPAGEHSGPADPGQPERCGVLHGELDADGGPDYGRTGGGGISDRAVDGQEIEIGPEDFDFETEAHFVDVEFLTRALRGSWTWDEEEQTLLLQIPGKALMNATD